MVYKPTYNWGAPSCRYWTSQLSYKHVWYGYLIISNLSNIGHAISLLAVSMSLKGNSIPGKPPGATYGIPWGETCRFPSGIKCRFHRWCICHGFPPTFVIISYNFTNSRAFLLLRLIIIGQTRQFCKLCEEVSFGRPPYQQVSCQSWPHPRPSISCVEDVSEKWSASPVIHWYDT